MGDRTLRPSFTHVPDVRLETLPRGNAPALVEARRAGAIGGL